LPTNRTKYEQIENRHTYVDSVADVY
jgi:hypothetical protein